MGECFSLATFSYLEARMEEMTGWNETRLSLLSKGKQDNRVERIHKELIVCTGSGIYGEWTVDCKVQKLEMEEVKGVRCSEKLVQ